MFVMQIFIGLVMCALGSLFGDHLPPSYPADFTNLPKEDKALIRDLKLIGYPPSEWKNQPALEEGETVYDVVIVGGGMAGLTAGAALFKEGIYHIKIFDQSPEGFEGPWLTTARMKMLRSPKDLVGPALDIPHLTFRAWFDARWGNEEWKKIEKIPTSLWMEYLRWYRKVLQLPVENETIFVSLKPIQEGFLIEFDQNGKIILVKARKVVLATGRGGFGGANIPDFMRDLPKSKYAHTTENIDFSLLKNKKVGVIGVGASGFDAAAVALEAGADEVGLITRRTRLPNVNKFGSLYYKTFVHGFYRLSNDQRLAFMNSCFEPGIPPPIDALKRLKNFENFILHFNTSISKIYIENDEIKIESNQGVFSFDFIILGTGFNINIFAQPELVPFANHIALWEDFMSDEQIKNYPTLSRFPYLGPHFEFISRDDASPYLKDLYCFNYGATMSHALISSDIPGISIGAKRLAEGIAVDFFHQEWGHYLKQLQDFNKEDFNQDSFFKSE